MHIEPVEVNTDTDQHTLTEIVKKGRQEEDKILNALHFNK
jgi:hypothetical protein